jgi:membrane protein DedA with SNARE-associated domain
MELFFGWIQQHGYAALAMLLMMGIVGVPVPDETLLTFAGYLVFKHRLAFLPTALAAFAGSICGITLSYGLGRSVGRYLIGAMGPLLRLDFQKMDRVQAWYARRGKYALLFGYFVPGVRHLVAFAAGASRLPLGIFALFAYTGGLLWCLSFITLGYALGEEWARTSVALHRFLVVGTVLFCLTLAVGLLIRKRRGRITA